MGLLQRGRTVGQLKSCRKSRYNWLYSSIASNVSLNYSFKRKIWTHLNPLSIHSVKGNKCQESLGGNIECNDKKSSFKKRKSEPALCELYVSMYSHTYSKSMVQPGKVANPARGQLNRENEYSPVRVRA